MARNCVVLTIKPYDLSCDNDGRLRRRGKRGLIKHRADRTRFVMIGLRILIVMIGLRPLIVMVPQRMRAVRCCPSGGSEK